MVGRCLCRRAGMGGDVVYSHVQAFRKGIGYGLRRHRIRARSSGQRMPSDFGNELEAVE